MMQQRSQPSDERHIKVLIVALSESGLPGETAGLEGGGLEDAATFLFQAATTRAEDSPAMLIETFPAEGASRKMRIAVVNDDMPFLVDSIAATLTERQVAIHRILHPVLSVARDPGGTLRALGDDEPEGTKESLIYLEVDRIDARGRKSLERELTDVLLSVRRSVADWGGLRAATNKIAQDLEGEEGSVLVQWLLERHFTFLGSCSETREGTRALELGLLRDPLIELWSPEKRAGAFNWFEAGGAAPLILKSGTISPVHRRAPMEMIIAPQRAEGAIVGLSVVCGLWTSAALRAEPDLVPVLANRLAALEARHRFAPGGHSSKALRHAVSALPRDVLLGIDDESLDIIALEAMSLADRPRPKLVLIPDAIKRHLFAFAWLRNEAISKDRRAAITQLLESETGAMVSFTDLEAGDAGLGLLRFVLDVPPRGTIPEPFALDAAFEAMMRGWEAALEIELAGRVGSSRAIRIMIEWAARFPSGYRDATDAAEAASDLQRMAALVDDEGREVRIYRKEGDQPRSLRLKIYRSGDIIPLSHAVPVLENFGFLVLDQQPTRLKGEGDFFVHEFVVEVPNASLAKTVLDRSASIEEAISAVLEGSWESDGFNALMMHACLARRSVTLLRAWFRYLRQTGATFGLATVASVLERSPDATRLLMRLFDARHDPALTDADAEDQADAAFEDALGKVAALEDDRIFRLLRAIVLATLRTNTFSCVEGDALAFKLDSSQVPGLPKPLPWREIWVYSPDVEGIHLRGGPVARGGLRWSDRRDDFRTEILGLMKAQIVKNAVIVPTGAKGGFYPKRLPPPEKRDAFVAEGTRCYEQFIRALLSVTDNIEGGRPKPPAGVRIRDEADPYLVVAADKGTAKFSDTANAIALECGFWLGDAFASGGSIGYDHKAMGITARGAWISVQRHFAELGVDVQNEPIRVVGCGDMSGDVFGNGMLLSRSLKLVAAFDHRHIFIDPDPDPETSYRERQRLFAMPRSSWNDYDRASLSSGGGVFDRELKAIELSQEARACLGVSDERMEPSALIAAILRCQADLLWFGGIGTYVKAGFETHAAVGDAANDPLRIDAEQLRVKVVGEGANLGITQAARIVFALQGGRINTDFIDNSAGVDCSDHEVNIKIALDAALESGALARDERNALLAEMTDDVAELVLDDNRRQTLALSVAEVASAASLPPYLTLIETLEKAGRIDRSVEGIGTNEELKARHAAGNSLTRPEISVLLAHAKLAIQHAIEKEGAHIRDVGNDILQAAFPRRMRQQLAATIEDHQLALPIIATRIANDAVNRVGAPGLFDIATMAGASLCQAALAFAGVDLLFGLSASFEAVERSDITESERISHHARLAHFARRQILDLLRSGGREPSRWPASAAAINAERSSWGPVDADLPISAMILQLESLDGMIGLTTIAQDLGIDAKAAAATFRRLKEIQTLDMLA